VWDYNVAIAREALDMGFSELQWDYVRFPDVTARMRTVMHYPGSNGVSRAENIRNFIRYSKEKLRDFQVPVTADVFGLVTHLEGDVDIGQHWETVISTADVVLPMVYPSHYSAGLYGFPRPIAKPYEIVRLATADAMERTRFVRDSARVAVGEVMPWLEAMSIRGASYGPAKRWMPEHFASVLKDFSFRHDAVPIIFGGVEDAETCKTVSDQVPGKHLNLAGTVDLRQFMAILSYLKVFITNDSGPMHISAALGVPTVAVFGSTDPVLTGPLGDHVRVMIKKADCSPCFERECLYNDFRCLASIKPEEVIKAAESMMAEGEGVERR
jgi:hypothetical protein